MRFLRSLKDLCCLGRFSHSRSHSQRFRSLALAPSSGLSSLVQVSRWCSNEMSCRRCVHLCPSELARSESIRGGSLVLGGGARELPRLGPPSACSGQKRRAHTGGPRGAHEGDARSSVDAPEPALQ